MLITYIFVNMSILNICSWNATRPMSSALYLCNLLDQELRFLSSIHSNCYGMGVCDSDLNVYTNRTVGEGGVAIIWNNKLNDIITPLSIDNDRIIGIQNADVT